MPTQPNMIVFFTDQQRWDTCGCYGQKLDVTPHLDQMAAEGVRFEQTFTCQPLCGPARAALQTGRYPSEVGCDTNHRLLPIEAPTLAKQLAGAGYETAYIGKWHLASCGPRNGADDFRVRPVPMERRGGYQDFWLAADALEHTSHSYDGHMFDSQGVQRDFPAGTYRVDAQTDWVIEYLETRDRDRPLFLFLSYLEPHHQNDHDRYEGPHGSRETFAAFEPPPDLEGRNGNWQKEYPDYLGCCHSLDRNLGRLRATLDKLGMTENTLLVFTSDHGSHFRTRNGEYKRSCHESCIRIPLVLSGPGFRGGRVVSDRLVSLIDLPPTLLSAAGTNLLDNMRGRPLQHLLKNSADGNWPENVFLQISESHCGRAIRTSRWKYSVRAPGMSGNGEETASPVYVEDFFYDLEQDPYERNNLVTDPATADIRRELAVRLQARMAEIGEPVPRIDPATTNYGTSNPNASLT